MDAYSVIKFILSLFKVNPTPDPNPEEWGMESFIERGLVPCVPLDLHFSPSLPGYRHDIVYGEGGVKKSFFSSEYLSNPEPNIIHFEASGLPVNFWETSAHNCLTLVRGL